MYKKTCKEKVFKAMHQVGTQLNHKYESKMKVLFGIAFLFVAFAHAQEDLETAPYTVLKGRSFHITST